LFLAAKHGPKTCLTSQDEHALIRPWLWTLASDVGSYMFGQNGNFIPLVNRAALFLGWMP
jgi:hypothetical protein